MRIFGIGMVRNEESTIGEILRHLASEGLAGAVVLEHLSTDNTLGVLLEAQRELAPSDFHVEIRQWEDPGFRQSFRVTELAALAAEKFGATWLVPFDGDELWHAEDAVSIRAVIEGLAPDVNTVVGRVMNHWPTALDSDEPCPFRRMRWRSEVTVSQHKVAFRWEPEITVWAGNHGTERIHSTNVAVNGLVVRHFPVLRWEEFKAKAAKLAAGLKAGGVPPSISANWRAWAAMIEEGREAELRAFYMREFHKGEDPAARHCVEDPAPLLRFTR